MSDIFIRVEGRAGRITLQRPEALNALTYEMVLAIETALDDWRVADIDLVMLDAEGDRAFCSGGDIADMYASGQKGDLDYGRQFWRDEYRLNAKIFEYPKPIVSFLQGFTMGGGVGVGCHGSLRIVGDSSQIAMPECGIGLVPDVGGSLMLALAPGRLGEYLGLTATRMGPADAIFSGFADAYAPEAVWPDLKAQMILTGEIPQIGGPAPAGVLQARLEDIDRHFAGETLGDIVRSLKADDGEFAQTALKALNRNAPLAMACAMAIVRRLRSASSIRQALDQEFRYTYRSVAQGDFIEGIRAAIIDRDRSPKWAHDGPEAVKEIDVSQMLMPLGAHALNWEEMP
ncbi:enoyl-CoA hydratase/isomerase family protein [Litoreibacter janthinus]|uniref:3-hydroxyisobutyryl-CoA hydrolase n=1 Tax=Litoreibacter janthinus TaxID=670154 RepID=A0A1I6H1M1_9RHOB|nr:3-hydroxyisobutyryl-CoA hydrolase [Litoreibacter janthinus]SFR48231.1 Enoyl-CoA hydratase/carnithine racemase [Litoreibacter janthinus]